MLSFVERPQLFITALFLAIPLYYMMWQLIFDSWDEFLESLRLFFQPDWFSLLRGEWQDDQWASIKILIFIILCLSMATTIYKFGKMIF